MSGGIAYVYDPNNRLYSRINKELVSYSSVTSKYDEEELRDRYSKSIMITLIQK